MAARRAGPPIHTLVAKAMRPGRPGIGGAPREVAPWG